MNEAVSVSPSSTTSGSLEPPAWIAAWILVV
jgi:hypothetical protein